MNAYEAYRLYIGLKLHFTTKGYDFVEKNGAVKSKVETFEARNDRFIFNRLAKQQDPKSFLIANFVDGRATYIADIMDGSGAAIYTKWLKRKQSLTRTFQQDLNALGDKFLPNLAVTGTHPTLLSLYSRKKLCIETLIIIDDVTDCFRFWNQKIDDPVYWPEVHMKCVKYRAFLDYDKNKFKNLLIQHFV